MLDYWQQVFGNFRVGRVGVDTQRQNGQYQAATLSSRVNFDRLAKAGTFTKSCNLPHSSQPELALDRGKRDADQTPA